MVREKREKINSLHIPASIEWKPFSKKFKVPEFLADKFAAAPILTIKPIKERAHILLNDIQLHVAEMAERKAILARIERYLSKQAKCTSFDIPEALSWTHENYVMGFVFIWDAEFWDSEQGKYTVDRYCQTMRREFGGKVSAIPT